MQSTFNDTTTNFFFLYSAPVMAVSAKYFKNKLFLTVGIIGLFAILIGFSTTFLIPVSRGSFKAPVIVHIHAAFAFSWVALFIMQSLLIQSRNVKLHKQFGLLGIFIAAGIVITFVPVGLYQVERELNAGLGQTAISSILGTITSGLIFGSLVIAGILMRKRPSIHKQLMLLATILLLWPAWFRFRHIFPSVPNPEVWFAVVLADSLFVLSIAWHRVATGKFSPTLMVIGFLIIAEHVAEVYFFDGTSWRALANVVYGMLL